MEFSFASITLIDVGVLSLSIIGLWWLKNQVVRYKTLSEELDTRCNTLQQKHDALQQIHEALQQEFAALQQEFSAFQSAADRRYNTLQEEYDTLKTESDVLRTGLETITMEHKRLERTCDTMAGRYQEIRDKFTLILEKLADRS